MSQVPISSIVSVQITRETARVTQAGFGVPLILTDETPAVSWGVERVRSYESTTEVLEDWASSDDAYKAAAAIFSQNPKVEEVKIGIEAARVAQVQTIVFSAAIITGNSIACTIDAVALTATPFNTTNAQTLTDLAAKIQATAGVATAISNGTDTITVTSQDAGVSTTITGIVVTGGASQATAIVATTVANHGFADDIAEIIEEDDDWYGCIWTERGERFIPVAAAHIETLRKIFGTCTADTDVLDDSVTDDIGSLLALAGYDRTYVIWNADITDYADAAWMGKNFPFDPGSETWMFKKLSGITVDVLTSSQRSAAKDKSVNTYVQIGGNSMTEYGTMASGEFIDIMRFVDWLQARMEESIFGALIRSKKIPYTDHGIGIIEGLIRSVLQNGIRVGGLADDALDEVTQEPFTVTVPRAVDVDDNDRAARLLTGISFRARLAGAIHKVEIQGTVVV